LLGSVPRSSNTWVISDNLAAFGPTTDLASRIKAFFCTLSGMFGATACCKPKLSWTYGKFLLVVNGYLALYWELLGFLCWRFPCHGFCVLGKLSTARKPITTKT